MPNSENAFKVVVFSSTSPHDISRLTSRICREVPNARICGILYERRPGKPLKARLSSFCRNLKDMNYVRYVARRISHVVGSIALQAGSAVLRWVHGCRASKSSSTDFLHAFCGTRDIRLKVTADFHSEDSLAFVRDIAPDLAIVYGTRILKPQLFKIPRCGSINIHKRKVPDYRGGGPVGLWELLDGQREIGVTVHMVAEQVDAGAVVNAATIPIEEFDTLTSLNLKAHVVGDDLLIRSVADFASGIVCAIPQQSTGRTFRSPTPQQLEQFQRQIAASRPRFRPTRTRSTLKLALRTIAAIPIILFRNGVRRFRHSHPVIILFHHLVTDRRHHLGMPTELFLRHVQFLQKHYNVVSLGEAIRLLETNSVNEPTVVLTFDDGYKDNHINLRAVVERTGVPVTMFVSTSHMTNGTEFAHDMAVGFRDFAPLTWEQIRVMKNQGIEFGSHTRTHFDCGSTDEDALMHEIAGSKADLEQRTGEPIRFFSFPFGFPENISSPALRIASRIYPYVFSAYGGCNFAGRSSGERHLKRCCHVSDLWELELMLQSFLEFFEPKPPTCGKSSCAPSTDCTNVPTLSGV